MTVAEMARTIIELTPEDEQSLSEFADVENAAFQEYLDAYIPLDIEMVCKGCHGG